MATVDTWTQALCMSPPVFCGRRLLPFSLSHSVILRGLGNPYAYREEPAVEGDLLAALFVCRRTHRQNVAALYSGRPLRSLAWFVLRWGWRVRFDVADANFRQYIADYTRVARWGGGEGAGDPVEWGAPDEFHVHRVLCDTYGYRPDEAWNAPFGLARAYFDVHAEAKGARGLMTPYDIEIDRLLREEGAARVAGDTALADDLGRQAERFVAWHRRSRT